jgi:dihydrofolate synthase/folylpolyglutamate synthase
MTYGETIDYLYQRLPMFSRMGIAAYKKDLNNIRTLCAALGNPHTRFKSIHVAGTNGKGSVSHMLAAILQSQGLRTGLYTSPHLKDFRERIRVNGMEIDRDVVISFIQKIKPLIEQIEPSFFEVTVAMAFEKFAEEQVDFAVIETGLGGRLDSTNIVTPVLSVITNIGRDHMNILGDTLALIAGEKAGIIKEGVPVVIGETHPETKKVFMEKAEACGAAISFADRHWNCTGWSFDHQYLVAEVQEAHKTDHQSFRLDLTGWYQTRNLLTVLESVRVLRETGLVVSAEAIRKGLAETARMTGLHGRWERIHRRPDIILDVAHNEDGMKQVVSQLELMTFDQLHIVIGMVRDKEITPVLSLLPVHAAYYYTQASIQRAMPADKLASIGQALGLKGNVYPTVQVAIEAALAHARPDDLILVCGSVFLAGEVDAAKISRDSQ